MPETDENVEKTHKKTGGSSRHGPLPPYCQIVSTMPYFIITFMPFITYT